MGKGEKLEDIIRTLGSVAEGVTTAKGVKEIIDELGVTAPIAIGVSDDFATLILRLGAIVCTHSDLADYDQIYEVLYEGEW
jgi:hypothetical protein